MCAAKKAEAKEVTLFELVKLALDDLYEQAKAEYGKEADAKIAASITYLSKSYTKLTDPNRSPIDYRSAATRFAYVYKYVATHGDYFVQAMKMLADQVGGKIFPEGSARVSCIGGGPGSEIVAVLKYLSEKKGEKVDQLTCYLLDREQAWGDTWLEVDDQLDVAVQLKANFQPIDVTNPDTWESQKRFLQADLFTLSFFVSEVFALDADGHVSEFFSRIFAAMKPGALILYIDNGSKTFNEFFDGLCAKAKLKAVLKFDDFDMTPRHTEQADVVKVYREKFGQFPKLKGRVTWRAYRKP